MSRIDMDTTGEQAIKILSEGNIGAATVLLELVNRIGVLALVLFLKLDDAGIYGEAIWIMYKDKCGEDIEKFAEAIALLDDPEVMIDPFHASFPADDVSLEVQAKDEEYFQQHPQDDYYIRLAYPNELAMAGYEDYAGLILVYVIEEGVRLRRPVASTTDAVKFMVEFEKQQGSKE